MKHILLGIILLLTFQAFSQNARIDSLNEIISKTKNPAEKFSQLIKLNEFYGYAGMLDSSRALSERLLGMASALKADSLLAKAYMAVGGYFSLQTDFTQSLSYKIKSLTYAEKADNKKAIWLATKEIGVDYKLLKNYPESIKYLRKAEFLLNTFNADNSKFSRTYSHLAEVHLALGNTDSALHYIQLNEQKASKNMDAYGYARMLYIFATIYQAKGDTDLAESYFRKCMTFSVDNDFFLPLVNSCTDYGKILIERGQYEQAKQYALQGYRKATESGNKLGIINTADVLRTVYGKLNLRDSAYYFADIKSAYRDSVFNEQETNQIQNISFAQRIKEREEEALAAEESQQRKENIQNALIALGIIVFIILFFLLSTSIIVNEKWVSFFGILGLLVVFEFINLLIHPFLETITHHSPFLMLLALVALASLLIPLHHNMEKWIKEKMTEKNKNIRLENARKTIRHLEGE